MHNHHLHPACPELQEQREEFQIACFQVEIFIVVKSSSHASEIVSATVVGFSVNMWVIEMETVSPKFWSPGSHYWSSRELQPKCPRSPAPPMSLSLGH